MMAMAMASCARVGNAIFLESVAYVGVKCLCGQGHISWIVAYVSVVHAYWQNYISWICCICWRHVLVLAMPFLMNLLHMSALCARIGNAISLESVAYVGLMCLHWQYFISWFCCICRHHVLGFAMPHLLNLLHMSALCARLGNAICPYLLNLAWIFLSFIFGA